MATIRVLVYSTAQASTPRAHLTEIASTPFKVLVTSEPGFFEATMTTPDDGSALDARQMRARAARYRAMATQTTDQRARAALEELAEEYENIASSLESGNDNQAG